MLRLLFSLFKKKIQKGGIFVFNEEYGIRDRTVTGVQTCALPISGSTRRTSTPHGSTTRPRASPAWTLQRRRGPQREYATARGCAWRQDGPAASTPGRHASAWYLPL